MGHKHQKWHFLNVRHFSSGPAAPGVGRAVRTHLSLRPLAGPPPQRQRRPRPFSPPQSVGGERLCHGPPSFRFGWRGSSRPSRGLPRSQGPVLLRCCLHGGLCAAHRPACSGQRGTWGQSAGPPACPFPAAWLRHWCSE